MADKTPEQYERQIEILQQQIEILDRRIDDLTNPIPSREVLRFAESIRYAKVESDDTNGTYSSEDYGNLLTAQKIVDDILPSILESIRAKSVDPAGWKFKTLERHSCDDDLCSICRSPFQHFDATVKVNCIDNRDRFRGVCRKCVRQYAPLDFIELEDVREWVGTDEVWSGKSEQDAATEQRRIGLIDAIRRHAHLTHYAQDIIRDAPEWAKGAFGEWR